MFYADYPVARFRCLLFSLCFFPDYIPTLLLHVAQCSYHRNLTLPLHNAQLDYLPCTLLIYILTFHVQGHAGMEHFTFVVYCDMFNTLQQVPLWCADTTQASLTATTPTFAHDLLIYVRLFIRSVHSTFLTPFTRGLPLCDGHVYSPSLCYFLT